MRSWSARPRSRHTGHADDDVWRPGVPVRAEPDRPRDLACHRGPVSVVGSSGFIGSYLVKALRRQGTAVSLYPRSRPLVTDPDLTHADTIVFVAGAATPATAERRADLVAADRLLFDQLLTIVKRATQPTRLILASSGGTVYSLATPPPHQEENPVAPASTYGAMKAAMEADLLGCPWVEPVILRLANVYGPGQRPGNGQGVIAHWLHAVASGLPLVVYGDPSSSRDYVYIDDVVRAIVLVHDSLSRVPEVMNIGSGSATTLADLAAEIAHAVGDDSMTFARREPRITDRPHVSLTIERARSVLGWQPRVPLAEGLQRAWTHLSRIHRSAMALARPSAATSRGDRVSLDRVGRRGQSRSVAE